MQCGSKKSRFIKEQEASGLLLASNSPFKMFRYWGLSFKDVKLMK